MSLEFRPAHEGLGFRNLPPEAPKVIQPTRGLRDPFRESARPSTTDAVAPEPLWISTSIPKLKISEAAPLSESVQIRDRVFAFLVDTGLISGLFLLGLFLTTPVVRHSSFWFARPELLLLTALFVFMFQWTAMTAQEILMSSTIGKRLFALRIEGTPIQILIRALLFIPSFLLVGTGLIWALFEKHHLCWHDRASGTSLVKETRTK